MKHIAEPDIDVKPQARVTPTGYLTMCDTSACVGVKKLEDGRVAVINTTDPQERPVMFSQEEWTAFIRGAKDSVFDFDKE